MPRDPIELEYPLEYLSILDDNGEVDSELEPDIADDQLQRMFRTMLLAHEAMHEGKTAARAVAGQNGAFDARAIPAVVFTDPQIAWCGLTEAGIDATTRNVKVLRFPWQASGRAISMGAANGLTKLLVGADTSRVLGAGIVGPQAESLIAEAVLAIEMGATAEDMAASIHPHPTLTETLGEAGELFAGQAPPIMASCLTLSRSPRPRPK